MNRVKTFKAVVVVSSLSLMAACSSAESGGGSGGAAPGSSGGSTSGGQSELGGAAGATAPLAGGSAGSGGGGASNAASGNGGTTTNGGGAGNATTGGATASEGGCIVGKWPAADPTAMGPYEVVTENEVGPEAGEVDEETGAVPKFTLFRPKELSPGGLCHPVITWGNGTGSTPNLYRSLLGLLASHGFVVIGSNSKNVSRGEPKPMLVGVTWILEQNDDPSSPLYRRLDATHIGATGHSQGAMATSQASGDARIVTNVPIEGAMVQRNLHGPSMFFCGGKDDIVPCDGAKRALDAVTSLPAMYAENIDADHGSWMSFGSKPSPTYAAITAWMRVHLMGDDALEPWFYGPSCQLCEDPAWVIEQKNMP